MRPVELFTALGLVPSADLTDDDLRAAWRRVAAATHPDREDGGDPAAFAAAAAAYTELRTTSGRGEALADLRAPARWPGAPRPGAGWRGSGPGPLAARMPRLARRIWRGRPLTIGARVLAVTAVSAVAVAAVGWQPASLAVIAGMLTWLVLTSRDDLAPPS